RFGEFGVEMQWLRVHRQRREQHVVHLGDGARKGVLEHLADDELLEKEPGHFSLPRPYLPRNTGRRFSTKAATASLWSSVKAQRAWCAASRSSTVWKLSVSAAKRLRFM